MCLSLRDGFRGFSSLALPILLLLFSIGRSQAEQTLLLDSTPSLPMCSEQKLMEICEMAKPESSSVDINCSIDFSEKNCQSLGFTANTITKQLVFRGASASHSSADFDGALIHSGSNTASTTDLIEVRSQRSSSGEWLVPRNITIGNALVHGSIRLYGMGRNSENALIRQSSAEPEHVNRLRAAAPSGIRLDNIDVVGQGRNLIYFGPGVRNSSLSHSRLSGYSRRVGVYLDAESSGITIEHNQFDVKTDDGSWWGFYDRGWPQIALDGSSDNRISDNTFTSLLNRGVYLYRNCGEGGTIRYNTPSNNTVTNNLFEYNDDSNLQRLSPAVYLGSRNYGTLENIFPGSHCNDDEKQGVKAGSAQSNGDFAQYNQVISNQFSLPDVADIKRRKARMNRVVKVGDARRNKGNEVRNNRWIWR